MRIATWNVNSARARNDRIIDVLKRHDLDVLALQEIKSTPEKWDVSAIKALGYDVVAHGLNQWNGVAVISRCGTDNVETHFAGQPAFKDVVEARALGVTCGGVNVWSLYVPHGRGLDDPHYQYKLAWLTQLCTDMRQRVSAQPDAAIALMGDFNIAPRDTDVWDMSVFEGDTHVSQPEREAFFAFENAGFTEVTRRFAPGYTYWDYRQLRFAKNEGMKIDFVLASPALSPLVTGAVIDRDERRGKGASDHVPVIVDIDI